MTPLRGRSWLSRRYARAGWGGQAERAEGPKAARMSSCPEGRVRPLWHQGHSMVVTKSQGPGLSSTDWPSQ